METPQVAAPPDMTEDGAPASPLAPRAMMSLLDEAGEDATVMDRHEGTTVVPIETMTGGGNGSESDSDSDVVPETDNKAARPQGLSRRPSPPPCEYNFHSSALLSWCSCLLGRS